MASNLPVTEQMQVEGNDQANWTHFKEQWHNYLVASGLSDKIDAVKVATFPVILGNECCTSGVGPDRRAKGQHCSNHSSVEGVFPTQMKHNLLKICVQYLPAETTTKHRWVRQQIMRIEFWK